MSWPTRSRAGDAMDFGFTVDVNHAPFLNRRHNDLVIANGTFFDNRAFMPFVGYARNNQLQDPTQRQKHGLPPAARMASLDAEDARGRNYLEADWIGFEAIVSTAADQIAIAPGTLEREWIDGERRFFHYKTSAPIVNLLPFLSGSYDVARARWEDVDIEVYFHPDHAFNIERFLTVAKQSLAYMSSNFGPYPHQQLRIVEIPNYHGKIAFAFAQTIPFSESWTFTADLDASELDWLAAILAHEVAHQWWNHQVVPRDVQGSTLIAESLPQYAAMMVLDAMYGPQMVRRFLKHHLDQYLKQRGTERVREMPLARVENQAYIHYSKASLALYALKDRIGEVAVNAALRDFLEAHAFGGGTVSHDARPAVSSSAGNTGIRPWVDRRSFRDRHLVRQPYSGRHVLRASGRDVRRHPANRDREATRGRSGFRHGSRGRRLD